jgi:DNA (cytosine-5)-methyltransferase 1
MNKELEVADFFCGAGGFSEGFRQAGFKIVYAIDYWGPARKTHKINHPGCQQPFDGDILNICVDEIDEKVPNVDVILGSPPCVTFSSSNRAGNADKKSGIRLMEKFLQIIAIKKHSPKSKLKYWLMENVPNSRKYMKTEYTFKDLGITNNTLKKFNILKREESTALKIDTSDDRLYNSVYYGVPQKRIRFITGEFPNPKITNKDEDSWISLGKILNAFRVKNGEVTDPIYDFKIPNTELTDHFYKTDIPKFEWEGAMIKKQQARYYGKMSFPEDESKPARTVMATRSIIAREAMILSNGKPGTFRAPRIREVASLMSFPITYLFDGEDESIKYKLVGNAVCPKLAYSFAKSILNQEKIKEKYNPNPNPIKPRNFNDFFKNPPKEKKPRPKHPKSNFCEIVPNLKYKNFRIELDNNFPKNNKGNIIWRASIHHATGKRSMKSSYPSLKAVESILINFRNKGKVISYKKYLTDFFNNKIPLSAEEYQKLYCTPKIQREFFTPRKTLKEVKGIVDRFFPEKIYGKVLLDNSIKSKKNGNRITFNRGFIPDNKIPLRHVVALYALVKLTKLIK